MESYILLIIIFAGLDFSRGFVKDDDEICNQSEPNSVIKHPDCDYKEIDNRLVCFGGLQEKWKLREEPVRTLVLCNWPEKALNPQDVLSGFPSLRELVIVNGNLTRLTSPFTAAARFLEKLNVTGTKLKELPESAFANLSTLRILDLRNNSLERVHPQDLSPSVAQVFLSGNALKCTEEMAWILEAEEKSLASKIVDKEMLRCSAPHEGRPLVPVVEVLTTLKEECKQTVCDCELVYVVSPSGKQIQKQLVAFVSVNCSYRALTEMPEFLPGNTTTLHLTGNKIRDITPLLSNPVYKQVLELYLDDNLLESVVQLDGSFWLDHFRLLSIRGNKLSDLPTYALQNVLLQSGNTASLYLGNNPWRCDCHFTPGFHDLLIRYTKLIKDINDIKCAAVSGDDNSNKQIRYLTRTEICVSADEEPWLHPLDVLNIILAFLIFLILGKLLYDYWSFKRTGKLPWIVAKIP